MSNKKRLYTQKEMADRLGTSKSTVYRLLKEQGLKSEEKRSQTLLYSESVLKAVTAAFNERKSESNSGSESVKNEQLIALLKDELQESRKQIDNLNDQLKAAQTNLNQSQKIQLNLQEQIKQLRLEQNTTAAPENDNKTEDDKKDTDTEKTTTEPKKLKWWQKVFR